MTAFGVWLPLFASFAAAAMAGAILARDPRQGVNRIVALVLVCSAHWSLCQVLWNLCEDPEQVIRLVRLSSVGWLWLGPLALHIYVELAQEHRIRAPRLLRPAYAAAGVAMLIYVTTPWGVRSAYPTEWGWSFHFGALFPVAYLPTSACIVYVLWHWPRLVAGGSSRAERRLALWIFAAISLSMTVASITDVLLPILRIPAPQLGSTSQLALGTIVAWSVSRHGYLLLAPSAFAREILETLRDGVALLRQDGRLAFCNDAFAALVGRPGAALLDEPIAALLPELGATQRDQRDQETRLRRDDGEAIPVSVSASQLRDEKGRAVGRVLALRDLREVASLRSRLVTSGRLAAVGELAAGIAHEISNPVTFVRSNLVQLREEWEQLAAAAHKAEPPGVPALELEEGAELIEETLEGVDRVAGVVRDVRAFSHAGLGHAELADVNDLLDNAANVAALRYSVAVERCYGDLPPVRCAPHQLRQVFLNLIFNALQAVEGQGSIRLVTQRGRNGVVVRIQDDGCGIAPEVIDRIFDPFFTTRPVGEGTGLGLALCYQIVRNHGGAISVESEPGRGTSFFVRLPAAELHPC